MSFSKLIKEAKKNKFTNECSGTWAAIQLRLNSFSAEFLNVGVVYMGDHGKYLCCQLLSDYSKIKHLIPGDHTESNIKGLIELIAGSITGATSLNSLSLPSSQLSLSSTSFFRGNNEDEIVTWLFDHCVTLG